MKRYLYHLAIITLVLSSCNSREKVFQVSGAIVSADGKTVYLEQRNLDGVHIIDSAKLTTKGNFRFDEKAPSNPEFYQLRVGNQTAVFAVDSTEKIAVNADAKDLSGTFSVENSIVNRQIKEVMQRQQSIVSKINDLEQHHKSGSLDDMHYLARVDSLLDDYKSYAIQLILGNPSSAAAYYAVFQKINNYLIFDPYNKKDYAMFAAVATSWKNYYPETTRTKHLHDFCINALKTRKLQESNEEIMHKLEKNATQISLADISLTNLEGKNVDLKSLKGNVVLLDFTAYKAEFSPKHNIRIHDVYKLFKNKGFEIYQISFDSDDHFWKNTAANLPWIAVRDAQSVSSDLLKIYNIRQLPTAFLLNREGDIVARIDDFSKLSGELQKVL